MTTKAILKLGRINANEDEAKLIKIAVKAGEHFKKDDLMLTFETTKAAVDVHAPCGGKIVSFYVAEGSMVSTGTVVFEAELESDVLFDLLERVHEVNSTISEKLSERKVSFKAQNLAKKLSLNIDKIPSKGEILKESDVHAYVETKRKSHSVQQLNDVHEVKYGMTKIPSSSVKAVIFGSGGHAKSIHNMIREAGYSIAGVVDSNRIEGDLFLSSYKVLGTEVDLKTIRDSGIAIAFIGVGGATGNALRASIFNKLKEAGFIMPPLISKMASLDSTSHLGEATYVFPGATIGADCFFGNNVIVNQGSIICHDCRVGDHVHLAPGAILAGKVVVGSLSTIGMSSTIMNNVTIGDNVLVHNTVAVARDIPTDVVVTLNGILE